MFEDFREQPKNECCLASTGKSTIRPPRATLDVAISVRFVELQKVHSFEFAAMASSQRISRCVSECESSNGSADATLYKVCRINREEKYF